MRPNLQVNYIRKLVYKMFQISKQTLTWFIMYDVPVGKTILTIGKSRENFCANNRLDAVFAVPFLVIQFWSGLTWISPIPRALQLSKKKSLRTSTQHASLPQNLIEWPAKWLVDLTHSTWRVTYTLMLKNVLIWLSGMRTLFPTYFFEEKSSFTLNLQF